MVNRLQKEPKLIQSFLWPILRKVDHDLNTLPTWLDVCIVTLLVFMSTWYGMTALVWFLDRVFS